MKKYTYVGIGSSAGGLEALQKLVPLLPSGLGCIYIVAQHLMPNNKSLLATILAHHSLLPVSEVEYNGTFLPDHIYIIPSNCNLYFKNHHLVLEKIENIHHLPIPSVDTLFESLALYKNKNVIGILLSGSGHDGTKGMKYIKEHGGRTIAQSLGETHYEGMPKSAIEAGVIDDILTLEEIPGHLSHLIHGSKAPNKMVTMEPMKTIQTVLHNQVHLDLRKYKDETVERRIKKRMTALHIDSLPEYAEFLLEHHGEAQLLHQELLIGVTAFFRDKEAFNALENTLTSILGKKSQNHELRIWCVACSTGEEAYSLAILVHEICKRLQKNLDIRIFATDIDDDALAKARAGIYSEESLKELDQTLLDEYFIPFNDGYKVVQSLRQCIVFTHHDLLQDPPFINQDLISCRNLLIYLLPVAQKETFSLFHYALKDRGILFLGSSESTLLSVNYFTPLNTLQKIYEKEYIQNPPKISNHYFSKHLDQKIEKEPNPVSEIGMSSIEDQIAHTIFDFFAPHCIIVDQNFTMIYKKGNIPYIRFSDGFPTLNLLLNLDDSLRYDVKTLLIRALASKSPESTKFIETASTPSDDTFVRVIAYPFNGLNSSPMILLYFQELSSNDLQFNPGALSLPDESMMLKNLTSQLTSAREEIRLLSDELTINKETLQLMNEELQSSNEELQSSNEELETSNEELQSSNEELHVSLSHIENLQQQLFLILNSTLDGIMGLDLERRHTFINASAAKMLGFTADELIGKKSDEFWQRTKSDGTRYSDEECPIYNVLRFGQSHRGEEIFWRKDGTSFEVELVESPIMEGGKITGAVISFHDITEQNRLEKIAVHEHQLSDLYMSISGMLVMALDTNANIMTINAEGCAILGLPSDQVIGKNWIDMFIPSEASVDFKEIFISILSGKTPIISNYTYGVLDAHHSKHLMTWTNAAIKDEEGNITGVICSGIDISKEDALIQKLAQQEYLYKLTFQEANIGIAHIGLNDGWIDMNPYICTLLGYTKEELLYLSLTDIIHPEDVAIDIHLKKLLLENKRNNYQVEKRYLHKNGTIIWASHSVVLLRDEVGNPLYFLLIIRDITQLKLLMYDLEMEKMERQNIIEFAPIPIMLHDEQGVIILTNVALKECTGFSYEEIPTMDLWMAKLYPNTSTQYKQELLISYNQSIQGEPKEHHITTKTGENRVWLVSSVRLNHIHKDKPLIVSSAIDITEIQRKDEIMISQARQAAMGDMLAMIAHQWRQPLSIISMSSNTLKAHLELDNAISHDALEQVIETVNEQTRYLSRTIDDFRNFFKPDKVKDKVKMATIIEKLATLIQKGLDNNGISLELPKNQEFEILTYQNQLLQALINLINNAKDAIKEHNPTTGVIRIGITAKDGEIIIQVCDNGGGISPSVINTISQPYVTTKAENGTGLGLYMSNIIISKHLDGKLWWSSDNVGSCFYISLPMAVS